MMPTIQAMFQEYGSELLGYGDYHITIRSFFPSTVEIKYMPFDIINLYYDLGAIDYTDIDTKTVDERLDSIELDVDDMPPMKIEYR